MPKLLTVFFLAIFLITACKKRESSKDTTRPDIDGLIALAEKMQQSNSDTALAIARNVQEMSLNESYSKGVAESSLLMGKLLYQMGGFSPAIEQLNQALGYFLSQGDSYRQAEINVLLGRVYQRSGNYTQAFLFLHKAMMLYQSISNDQGMAVVYGGLGHLYEKTQAYDSALIYQKRALNYYSRVGDTLGLADIHDNIGSIYEDLNQFEEAHHHFQTALDYNQTMGNMASQIVNLNNIGDTYRKRNNFKTALNYSTQALKLAESAKLDYQIKSACRDLSIIYKSLNQPAKALGYLERSYELTDNIFSEQIAEEIAKTQAIYELEQKQQRITLLEKEHRLNFLLMLFSGIGITIFLILGGFSYSQQKSKNNKKRKLLETEAVLAKAELENAHLNEEKLTAELENKQLKEEQLQQELELKSKSLTKSALHMIQKNEFLHELRTKLKDIRKGNPEQQEKRIKKLIKSIDLSFTLDDDWQEFETVFQQVHSEFFEKLKTLYPKLSPAEVRLCAMIRLNLHSKDMSAIMGISQDSLRISRYRLRKKLGLGKGANLYSFILNIG